MMKPKRFEWLMISIILIIAVALRLYDWFNIPFTYDEFSALFRTRFSSFNELISNGARVDGHPAGIQVFLYYYVQWVGFSEPLIKLPFIIAGVASVYLTWRIGREWFSSQTALLAAASIAMMHFPIVYSQIARPYSSGLFFTLLMLLGWSRLVLIKDDLLKNYFYFIIGATLCMYNHHFSALMAVLAGISGLFLLSGKSLRNYFIANAIIVILYIPHVEILLNQLSMGGIGQWLNPPTPVFFYDYIKYIFHFSPLTAMVFFAMIAMGLVIAIFKKQFKLRKTHLIALTLGLLPAVIGYIYSVLVAPLLQFSVLLFSFPLLIILAFSVFEHFNKRTVHVLTLIWSAMMLYSLIFVRQHYQYFYHAPYEESIKEIKSFSENHSCDSTLVLCNFRPEITAFYQEKYDIAQSLTFINPDSITEYKNLHQHLSNANYKYLVLAKANENQPWLFAISLAYFPEIITENNYNQGSCIMMQKTNTVEKAYMYYSKCNFNTTQTNSWLFDSNRVFNDSTTNGPVLQIDSSVIYEATYSEALSNKINSRANVIDATLWVQIPDTMNGEALWVSCIENDTGSVTWRSVPINISSVPKGVWAPVSVSILVADLPSLRGNEQLKVYLYNQSATPFLIKEPSVGIRQGNRSIYWITYGLF